MVCLSDQRVSAKLNYRTKMQFLTRIFHYLDLPGNAIYEDMKYPIIPGLTSPGRLGARAPELSDIAYPHKLHFPVDPSSAASSNCTNV